MRSRVRAGDEWPNGSAVFQMTFVSGPSSAGRRVLIDTPDPFGPRKRDHDSGSGASADVLTMLRNNRATKVLTIGRLGYSAFRDRFSSSSRVTSGTQAHNA